MKTLEDVWGNLIDVETELVNNREVLVRILEQIVTLNETLSESLEVSRTRP